MKIKQNETKQIMCNVCKRVKNATLIHAKTSFTKRRRGLNITKVDTFTLQYRLDPHQRGTKLCLGSDKIQSKTHDGVINSTF
mgnify:FL=1|jgi:hypothetical protein